MLVPRSMNRLHLVPVRLAQDCYVVVVSDVPSIGPEMPQQLVRFSRNLSDVDGPFRVNRIEHLAVFEHQYLQHGPGSPKPEVTIGTDQGVQCKDRACYANKSTRPRALSEQSGQDGHSERDRDRQRRQPQRKPRRRATPGIRPEPAARCEARRKARSSSGGSMRQPGWWRLQGCDCRSDAQHEECQILLPSVQGATEQP